MNLRRRQGLTLAAGRQALALATLLGLAFITAWTLTP